MARGKKVKTGGKSRGTPRRSNSFVRAANAWSQDESDFAPSSFTLRDAAQSHLERPAALSSRSNLRHRGLQFVRASEGLKGTIRDSGLASASPSARQAGENGPPVLSKSLAHSASEAPLPLPDALIPPTGQPDPFIKTKRSVSPSPSASSEEVVLFTGRRKEFSGKVDDTIRIQPSELQPSSLVAANTSGAIPFTASKTEHSVQNAISASCRETVSRATRNSSTLHRDRVAAHRSKKRSMAGQQPTSTDDGTDIDGFLADYMDNLRAHGELDDDFVAKASGRQSDLTGWDLADLDDFGDLSTSDEVLDHVDQILSKRERASGLQYLVVWHGYTVDEARWIHHKSLTTEGALKTIEDFEEQEKFVAEYGGEADSASEDDDDDGDQSNTQLDNENASSSDAEGSFLDEEDLIARRIERMSDEQIARLLAKQEELGMGSDELLLFDDDDDDGQGDEDMDPEKDEEDNFIPFHLAKKLKGRNASRNRQGRSYNTWKPDLDDADLFGTSKGSGDFDLLDFERPSLSVRSRKKKGLKFDLSDSELEATLREQWMSDRNKKKAKKQEREDLRVQGLLGNKYQQKPNLSARYNEGLSLGDLLNEFEQFLSTSWESRAFPPMDKRTRKGLHELAAKFNLKSKSVGSGKHRFPVLYKTRKTLPFDEALFLRIGRRYFTRMDRRPDQPLKRAKSDGGSGHVSYMEGDKVGASAPEIGVENRGRAMLEKMGWSKGMALGSLTNQGITEPIAHIVKKSRTGLG